VLSELHILGVLFVFLTILVASMAVPVVVTEHRRARLLRRLGARRAAHVTALVYCREAVALFGFPVIRYATLSDPREVLAAIAGTPPDTPLDLVVQLPRGLDVPIDDIAAALAAHRGQVTLFVPLYALSGGLELAQAADAAVLGPRAAVAAATAGSPALSAAGLRTLGVTVHEETPAELAAYMRLCPQPPQPPARWFVDVPGKPGDGLAPPPASHPHPGA
jgi:Serine dehydrogenase proteinase